MPFTPTVVITNPQPGDLADFTGQTFVGTGAIVSVKTTSLQIRCTALGPGATAGHILVAMTKTGDFTAATSWHSFAVSVDGTVHDLAAVAIDYSAEMSLSNPGDALSGLIGVLIDWTSGFFNVKVEIAQPTVQLGFSQQAGQTTGSGLIYGEYSNCDEYVAIISGGAYSINGQYVAGASANHWSTNLLSGTTLNALFWEGCQFGPEEFITEPATGVFRRNICGLDNFGATQQFGPLYQDYSHPGSNGAGVAQVIQPPYIPHVFDHINDTLSIFANTTSPVMTPVASIDSVSNKPTIKITNGSFNGTGYIEYELDLAVAVDFHTASNLMPYLMQHYVTSKTLNGDGQFADADNSNLGFQSNLANYQIRFADATGFVAGHQTSYVTAAYHGIIDNTQQRDFYCFFDLNTTQGTFAAIMSAVKKIRVRFGPRGGGRPDYYRLEEFIPLGQYYHFNFPTKVLTPTTSPDTDGPVQWAFNYTEPAQAGQTTENARAINMTAAQALGTRYDPQVPFGGSFVTLTIPPAPAPFTGIAQINVYRLTSNGWQRVAQSVDNSDSFVFADTLSDFTIIGDTVTYPVTVLNFDPLTAADSGQATLMINCCSWKGSLIFFGTDGNAYGSQSNNPQVFFWPRIDPDLTGVDPSAVPRTLQIANNRGLPVLVGVPQSILYMFTRKEGYTMRSLTTFAQADFPSKIANMGGACGTRAACAYDAGALVGSDDSLWYVAVNPYQPTISTEPPDQLIDVTKENRGLWAKLIGNNTQRAKLIVRCVGKTDIWCFCESRYIHISRRFGLTYGEWATGKSVAAAHGDCVRGMVVLFSDGTIGVCGAYLTDGGLDVLGATGNPPNWLWRGKRHTQPMSLISARAVWENQSVTQPSAVAITAYSERGSPLGDDILFSDAGGVGEEAFDTSIIATLNKPGGCWFEIQVSGSAWDRVTRLDVHATPSEGTRVPR